MSWPCSRSSPAVYLHCMFFLFPSLSLAWSKAFYIKPKCIFLNSLLTHTYRICINELLSRDVVVSSSLKQSYLMTLIGKNRRATSAHFHHFLLDDVSRAHMAHRVRGENTKSLFSSPINRKQGQKRRNEKNKQH